MSKKLILRGFSWAIILATAVFFFRSLQRDWGRAQEVIANIHPVSWVSILFFVFAVAISGMLWARITTTLCGKKVSALEGVRIHSASWLLKYIPGQVGSLVNKLSWASAYGYSKKLITASVIYENVLMVFASIILSVPLLFIANISDIPTLTIVWCVVLVLFMVVAANQKVFYRLLNILLKLVRKKPLTDALLTTSQIIQNTLLFIAPRVMNGIGFLLIAVAILPVTIDMYIPFVSIYIFASIIGMLALFVPSGLGVREGIIVALVSIYFPTDQAVILALAARFFTTIADVGVFIMYMVLNKGRITQR